MISQHKTGIPQWLIALPVITWTATLAFGTILLFILLKADKDSFMVAHAFNFVATIVFINAIVLLFMLGAILHHKPNNRALVSGVSLMLSNILIAFVYYVILTTITQFTHL
jgi:hypothetical protein